MINNKIVIFLPVAPLHRERHKWQLHFTMSSKLCTYFVGNVVVRTLWTRPFFLFSHFALSRSLSFSISAFVALSHLLSCRLVSCLNISYHKCISCSRSRTPNTLANCFLSPPHMIELFHGSRSIVRWWNKLLPHSLHYFLSWLLWCKFLTSVIRRHLLFTWRSSHNCHWIFFQPPHSTNRKSDLPNSIFFPVSKEITIY